jgi:hypothetical protein
VGSQLIYGDNVDPDPAGLVTFGAEHPAGVLAPAGGAGAPLALADLDTLIRTQRPWDGGQPRFFVMNSQKYSDFFALCRAAGFHPCFEPDPVLGRPLASYAGVSILVSDFILDTESADTTSVYLVHLGPREGDPQLGGLLWLYAESTGPEIRADGPHRDSDVADTLYVNLDLNIAFATLSTGSVVRMAQLGT